MKIKGSNVVSAYTGGKDRPRITLSGNWLDEIGFTVDTIFLVEKADTGFIILKACGKGMEAYNRFVKKARMHGMKLIQVSTTKAYPRIRLEGFWLERWGFSVDDIIAIAYEIDLIRIKRIDCDTLGF